MTGYVLTSFVGKQVMSVLNAIDSCFCKDNINYPVEAIHLYATEDDVIDGGAKSEGTLPQAKIVEQHCKDRNYAPVEIFLYKRTEDHSEEFIKRVPENNSILFYLEGGMNFSVAYYVSKLNSLRDDSAFLISDGNIYRTISIRDAFVKLDFDETYLTIREKSAKQILDEQNVNYEIMSKDTPLSAYIKRVIARKDLPINPLFNVKIDGVPFELVWNCGGNHLALLGATANLGSGSNTYLKGVRAYAGFASGKSGGKAFYDCRIYIQCIKGSLKEQVEHEGRGKAIALNTNGYAKDGLFYANFHKDKGLANCDGLNEELKRIFKDRYRPLSLDNSLNKKVVVTSDSFITVMGKDSSATLKALESHFTNLHSTTAILLSTPDLIEKCKKLIGILKNKKGFSKIKFRIITTDIKGRSIAYRMIPEDGAQNISVNVTPGTKGQTAFLTLFVVKHNFQVWSLRDSCVIPVSGCCSDEYSVEPFDPLPILSSETNKVEADNYKKTSINLKKAYAAVLKIFNDEFNQGKANISFEEILMKSGFVLYKDKNNLLSVKNEILSYDERLGDWFESLTCAAFFSLKDSVVYKNVKFYRSDLHGHVTEIDSLVSTGHLLIAVSCKAYLESELQTQVGNYHKALAEVISFARSVNRLCLPVLCCIDKYHLKDVELVGEAKIPVAVISLRELCDSRKLKAVIDKLDESVRYDSVYDDVSIEEATSLE